MPQNPEHTESPDTTETPAEDVEQSTEDTPEEHAKDDGLAEEASAEDDAHPEGDSSGVSEEKDVLRLEAELASAHDKLLRAVAETENVRRRAQRDKEDTARYSVSNFARDLVAVADNLRRALDSVEEGVCKENPAIENLMIGVEMTERELLAAFERNNIRRMEPVGLRFDPNVHEAMFEYDDADQPAGTVGQVIESGYLIHDRPLRPAKVGITKGGPKADASSPCAPQPGPDDGGETSAYEGRTAEPGEHIDEEL